MMASFSFALFLSMFASIQFTAMATIYCDGEGLMYSDDSQIDAVLMSQMIHTDGATAIKAHPTQG